MKKTASLSLSERFPITPIDEFVRACAAGSASGVGEQPAVPPTISESVEMTIEVRLRELGYSKFHFDLDALPRHPPTTTEWQHHLDQVRQHMQFRSFSMDSDDLVQWLPGIQGANGLPEEPCANGATSRCVGQSMRPLIFGLDAHIVLRRMSSGPGWDDGLFCPEVEHAPYCVLCMRAKVAELIIKDRLERKMLDLPSRVSRPGPEPFQHTSDFAGSGIWQTFYNPRDCPGGYRSEFMWTPEEGDLFLQPFAKLDVRFLTAELSTSSIAANGRNGVRPRWRILQTALQYNVPSRALAPVAGETVASFLQRVSDFLSTSRRCCALDLTLLPSLCLPV